MHLNQFVISLCASVGLILINYIIPNGYLSKHPITPDQTRKQVEYLLFLTPSFSLSDNSTCFIAIFIWAAILKRKKNELVFNAFVTTLLGMLLYSIQNIRVFYGFRHVKDIKLIVFVVCDCEYAILHNFIYLL